ncbi:hypothetical protein EOD41_13430 [Mucilaginibacter limnophilus]|uniref:Uncharacterized protein n=1 Tax=Mucilaginibacter limnophilus TaxID=1932778 RepID=A0A3S2UNJ1_9SPHI|nr:hypothetical protein [Mucilaginibacter limnophilus]RVU00473.1 hypothetical protein EOD41_13430 [Mucilaginibacter limnophilus]
MDKFQFIGIGLAILTGIFGVSKLYHLRFSPGGSKLSEAESDCLIIGIANLLFSLIAISCIFLKWW